MKYKIVLLLVCILTIAVKHTAAQHLQPNNLTCEYLHNPHGIDIPKPRLSLNFIAVKRNQSQTAYQIIVSDNEKDCKVAKGISESAEIKLKMCGWAAVAVGNGLIQFFSFIKLAIQF